MFQINDIVQFVPDVHNSDRWINKICVVVDISSNNIWIRGYVKEANMHHIAVIDINDKEDMKRIKKYEVIE